MVPSVPIPLSRKRIRVVYRIRGDERVALATARDICVEQTVEFPLDHLPAGDIRDQIVGHLEEFQLVNESHARATISYPVEATGGDLTQLLNLIDGNYSLKPGVRAECVELPETLSEAFRGPRFGRDGLRSLLGVPSRPLLGSALKPLGLPSTALADLAYRMALGGIDLVKDDHGLANQPFASFDERVHQCADAVARANRETGGRCIYLANVTASGDEVIRRARLAKAAGAGGLLIAPGLAGFGTLEQLTRDDRVGLPVMSHPAFLGNLVGDAESGVSPFLLLGQIARLAGADASIFPGHGGRFAFSPDDCRSIVRGAIAPMGGIKPIFPVPAGGMTLPRLPELLDFYGPDTIFLIGGDLFRHGPSLVDACRAFRRFAESAGDRIRR